MDSSLFLKGKKRLALVFQRNSRVAMGERCLEILQRDPLLDLYQFDMQEIQPVKGGFDLYIRFDDGDYTIEMPRHLRPAAWWISDTHLKKPYKKIRRQVRDYDYVFLAQKDDIQRLEKDAGVTAHWLPWAADALKPSQVFLGDDKRQYDICFIGTEGKYSLRKVVIETIRYFYPQSYIGRAEREQLYDYYSRAKIVVNYPIHNDINARFFEAMGAGAMLLTYRIKGNGFSEIFQENKHVVAFDDILSEMRQKIDFYLEHAEERLTIAKNSFDLVNASHTYRHRLKEMFRIMGIALSEVV
ncbi:MAG: glycosyltransferase [Candidatus Omnitrophica bacterium]|nr:glycosyltransferase [Candidatus Omnitrophota bacterium]MDD5573843.1 glycosyltransferase [Candidatus Omnitrophota bacterium]